MINVESVRNVPIIDRRTTCSSSGPAGPAVKRSGTPSAGRRRYASVAVAFLVACGALMVALSSYSTPTSALDYHEPFSILGDSEFLTCTAVSGGSGTESDPYVISALEIYGSATTGVWIEDTTAHFVIRDVHINSTQDGSRMSPAIQLENVSNATIQGSLINATFYGIVVIDSDNVTISGVEFESVTGWDIDVARTDDLAVVDSALHGQNGMMGSDMSRLVVMSCEMDSVDVAVTLSSVDNVTVQASSLSDCGTSVSITDGDGCAVTGNSMTSGTYGVLMTTVQRCNVSGNLVHEMAAQGILLDWHSQDSSIYSNTVSNCSWGGISVADALGDCTVSYNVLRNNSYSGGDAGGVLLLSSVGVSVHHNSFFDNAPQNAYDSSETDNRWNETYPSGGNYWDDYSGVDLYSGVDQDTGPSDGFGDTPYELDTDTFDHYPLVDALNVNTPPVASFTVIPSSGEVGTQFDVDASACSDAQDATGDLRVRWDWDGDGTWDTSFSTDKAGSHTYLSGGTYTLRMEVVDTGGLTNTTTRTVEVTGTAIPEFTSLVVPVLAIAAVFIVAGRRR